ncbi:MAG: FkbM family methyltransferase [Betaproteobacteria bacterium]|nr:FkbM family methyltransferase [Betaproteobacteria bacterium]
MDLLHGKAPVALKIDIEGAEIEALSSSAHWLARVDAMVIELHDRFRPGCSTALEQALDGYECGRSMSGESVVVNERSVRAGVPIQKCQLLQSNGSARLAHSPDRQDMVLAKAGQIWHE